MPRIKDKKRTIIDELQFSADLELDNGTPITIGFDRDSYEWLNNNLKLLFFSRGISEATTTVDSNAAALMRQRAKRKGRKEINMRDVQQIRSRVSSVMSSAADETIAELLLATVIDFDDEIYEFQEPKEGGIRLVIKEPYDMYEIPDWYFPKDTKGESLGEMFARQGLYVPNEPSRDSSNPLEIMCGHTAGILEQNPNFASDLRNYIERAQMANMFGGLEVGQNEVFLQSIKKVLFDTFSDDDQDVNGGIAENGILTSDESNHPSESDGITDSDTSE